MARSGKRTGFGSNRGATNPRLTISAVAPSNPKKYDLWLDISGTPTFKYWDGSTWQSV